MALTYVGIAFLADAPWALVPLPLVLLVINNGVIVREERYLERKFGSEYLDYKARAALDLRAVALDQAHGQRRGRSPAPPSRPRMRATYARRLRDRAGCSRSSPPPPAPAL